jgi:hypothetical protein
LGLNQSMLVGAILALAVSATGVRADSHDVAGPEPTPVWMQALDNEYYKISLNVRSRMEIADIAGFEQSEAYTVRIRAGIGNKPIHGFTAYAELENTNTLDEGSYYNGVETPTGQSLIADPEETELNQFFLRYDQDALHGTVGRQRILLDDQRFIGNVGWRQNEQTFDAVWMHSSLNIEGFDVGYGYLKHIRRIFGDDGDFSKQDWDSNSHLIHVSYGGSDWATVTGFAYLFDFDGDAPANSSNTYGLRLTGSQKLGDTPWSVAYAGSYARQIEAADNPVDYNANYGAADGSLAYDGIGKVGAGYELLGSDDGKARLVTPLATAHKFNGFADVFGDNGGVDGLQDFYVYLSPTLPWKFTGEVTYHRFWSDHGGTQV